MSPAQPIPARLWHVPQMTSILWGFIHRTPWLPRVRSYRTDLHVMMQITRAGWVRILRDWRGPVAFIARDGTMIHALYVHPRAQRRGMGRLLLEDAKRAQPRLELFVAEANLPARAFYDALDFAEVARSDGANNDERLPDIRMSWQQDRSVAQ